jgi:hypothetical protein
VFRVRVSTLAAVVVAVLAAATTAGAATRLVAANCSCGSLWAHGGGTASTTASAGAVWGSLGKGTLWVRAASGHIDVQSTTGFHKTWDSSARAWKYVGRNLLFQTTGRLWVKAQGTGVAVSANAVGTASLKGTGSYRINGGRTHDYWPTRLIQLRG